MVVRHQTKLIYNLNEPFTLAPADCTNAYDWMYFNSNEFSFPPPMLEKKETPSLNSNDAKFSIKIFVFYKVVIWHQEALDTTNCIDVEVCVAGWPRGISAFIFRSGWAGCLITPPFIPEDTRLSTLVGWGNCGQWY